MVPSGWGGSGGASLQLVNGVLAGFFFPCSKGLRLGDPLSLSLLMSMEVLCILLRRAMAGGYISGCTLRGQEGDNISISHLLLDDIFCFVVPLGTNFFT